QPASAEPDQPERDDRHQPRHTHGHLGRYELSTYCATWTSFSKKPSSCSREMANCKSSGCTRPSAGRYRSFLVRSNCWRMGLDALKVVTAISMMACRFSGLWAYCSRAT